MSHTLREFSGQGGPDWIPEFVRTLKVLGKGDVLVSLALVLGVLGFRRQALQILIALILVTMLVWPVKIAVGRERPRGESFVSFPSGDAASAAAAAVPIVARFPWALPLAGAAVFSVAAGRVVDAAHYPSDVSAGIAFGIVAGVLALWVCRHRYPKWGAWTFLILALAFGVLRGGMTLAGGGEFTEYLKVFAPALLLAVAGRFFRLCSIPMAEKDSARERAPGTGRESFGAWINGVERDRRIEAAVIIGITVCIFALYLFSTTRSTLWDRDEPRFARATVEMVQSGNLLYPTFNGKLRPDKPILIYWLMSLTVRLFGQTELACRFFAPLGTALACLLTYYTGRRLLGLRAVTSILAAVVVATTPLMTVSGTAATTDGFLLFLITAAMAALVRMMTRGVRWPFVVLAILALGAAQLTKGPVGLAVVLLSFGLMIRLNPLDQCARRPLYAALAAAAVISLGLFAAWAVPANNATGGELFRLGIGHHVVERTMKPLENHGGSFFLSLPYYVPVVLLGFFPWTLFLPGAAAILWRRAPVAVRAILLGWILPTFVLMSLVGTKLPHYILPIFPGLALAVACLMERCSQRGMPPQDLTWMRRGTWLLVPLGILLGLSLVVAPWFIPLTGVRGACVSLGLLLLMMTALGLREFLAARYGSCAAVLALGMLLFQLCLVGTLLPGLERYKTSPAIASEINRQIPVNVPVAAYKYEEPSLIFYLDRRLIIFEDEKEAAQWLLQPGERLLVTTRGASREIQRLCGAAADREMKMVAEAKGFNYSKGRWVDLVVLQAR